MRLPQALFLTVALAVVLVLSFWGPLAERIAQEVSMGASRPKKIAVWSNSGTPQFERRTAKDFMEEFPDTFIDLNFTQSGQMGSTLHVSFMSGSPPDLLPVTTSELRGYVAQGMLRPATDLLEQTLRERGEDFITNRLVGEEGMVYFRANPDDPLLALDPKTGGFLHPVEAARLLKMDGQFMGLTGMDPGNTLTYNKRLFREAAAFFQQRDGTTHGLVDDNGRAAPPRTWVELLDKAKRLREYGRESGSGIYGIVIQGQKAQHIMRFLDPMMATAGTRGFDFRTGRFDYADPAVLGALKLLKLLQAYDTVLPGTGSRDFEESRILLTRGDVAMLLDGWHSAMVGVGKVPWASNDMGSATIPVPYELNASGTPNAAQKAEIEALLRVGDIGRGTASRGGLSATTTLTSAVKNPQEAWAWQNFDAFFPERERAGVARGSFPGTRRALAHLDDPTWFPYPYQQQLVEIQEAHQFWPQPPNRPNTGTTPDDILKSAFTDIDQLDPNDPNFESHLDAFVEKQGGKLRDYSTQVNHRLAAQADRGELRMAQFTYPDFDPLQPARTLRAQNGPPPPSDAARLDALKKKLPPDIQAAPAVAIFDEFHTDNSPWSFLWVLALMGAVVIAYLIWAKAASVSGRGDPTSVLRTRARENWYSYIFVFPAMLALFGFVLYPSLYQFYLAGHTGNGIGPLRWVGWEQFQNVLHDKVFWFKVLPKTFLYMIVVTSGQIVISLFIANLLNIPMRFSGPLRILFFVPLVVSLSAVSVVFLGLLSGPNSGVNGMLDTFGLEDLPYYLNLTRDQPSAGHEGWDWLGKPETDLWAVMAVGIWHGLPYNIILILAALQAIDPQLYEAAKVDGANPWHRLIHVTIPETLPILVIIVFNALIGAARAFGTVYILTQGGTDHSSEVVATYIFKWGFNKTGDQDPDVGYASALGIVYALILGAMVFVNVYFIARSWKARLSGTQRGPTDPEADSPEAVVTGRIVATGSKGVRSA